MKNSNISTQRPPAQSLYPSSLILFGVHLTVYQVASTIDIFAVSAPDHKLEQAQIGQSTLAQCCDNETAAVVPFAVSCAVQWIKAHNGWIFVIERVETAARWMGTWTELYRLTLQSHMDLNITHLLPDLDAITYHMLKLLAQGS